MSLTDRQDALLKSWVRQSLATSEDTTRYVYDLAQQLAEAIGGTDSLFVNVLEYGADSTGATDSAAAIQDAIDSTEDGRTILFPAGRYRVNSKLRVNGRRGMRFLGEGVPADPAPTTGTQLIWGGASTVTPMWEVLGSQNCHWADMMLSPLAGGAGCYAGFQMKSTVAEGGCRSNSWSRVKVFGQTATSYFQKCWEMALDQDNTNDLMLWENCQAQQYTVAGWDIRHAQSALHRMHHCTAETFIAANTAYGVRSELGSNFTWHGGYVAGNGGADFYTDGSLNPTVIEDLLSELSAHLLVSGAFPSSLGALELRNVVFDAATIAANNRVYDVQLRQMLVRNFKVKEGTATACELRFTSSPNGNYIYHVQSAHITTTLADPFTGQPPTVRQGVWVDTGSVIYKPDVYSNVQGISGADDSTAPAKNLRGEFNFVGGSGTSAVVTLPTAEVDGLYYLAITPVGLSGSPAAGANRVLRVTKAASQFTLFVEADPGTVNDIVKFDWHLFR